MSNNKENNTTFAEKHPVWNSIIGIFVLLVLLATGIILIYGSVKCLGVLIKGLSKLDAVVIVAIITGGVSITGVIISSIIGKSLEYKKSRNEYLAQKREGPYGDFVDMIYKIQRNTKEEGTYKTEEMIEDILKFNRQLTLWGSPKVAQKWNEFRKNSLDPHGSFNSLLLTEEIMNEMRADLGTKKIKKGGLLSFFINDIDDVL